MHQITINVRKDNSNYLYRHTGPTADDTDVIDWLYETGEHQARLDDEVFQPETDDFDDVVHELNRLGCSISIEHTLHPSVTI